MIFAPSAFSVAALHRRLLPHRLAVLALAGLLWLVALWLGGRTELDNSSLTFFPDSDADMARMAQAMDMAPFSRLLLVDIAATEAGQEQRLAQAAQAVAAALPPELAVRAGSRTLPEPQNLLSLLPPLVDEAVLARLEKAARPEAVEKAVGTARETLGGLWGSVAAPWLRHDPLNFRSIILERLPKPPGAGIIDPVLGFPLSGDGRHVLLALRPARSLHDVTAATQLLDALNAALKEHVPADLRATVVGAHRHSAANTRSINNDIRRIALWSLAGFVLVYALLVRSLTGAFWLLLTPLAAVSATLGSLSLLWPVISGLALGFGASVLGIAEDYAVHMHFALRSARAQGFSTGKVLDMLALPLFQGFLLNISGFVVLLFSGIPALRQLAAFALLTLTVGLCIALVLLPLCPGFDRPALAPPPKAPPARPRGPRAVPVALCAVLLLGICAFLWSTVRTDLSPRGMGADMESMQEDAELLRRVWGGRAEGVWVVQGQEQRTVLDAARRVSQALRQQGQEVDSLTDLWPDAAAQAANVRRWSNFVAAHPQLPEVLRTAGQRHGFADAAFAPFAWFLSRPPQPMNAELLQKAGFAELTDTFLLEDKDRQGRARVRCILLAQGQEQTANGTQNSETARPLPPLPPSVADVRSMVTPLSPTALEDALLRHLQHERRLLPAAAVVCVLLLFICFRRVPPTLLAALPALAALAAILIWHGSTDTPLTLAGLATLPLVLGLALDHGVVVTHDLALGRHLGVDRAIVTSSLTALTGMGLLALAEHPALRSMGQIIFPGLVMEMLVALWLLPLLCAPVVTGTPVETQRTTEGERA